MRRSLFALVLAGLFPLAAPAAEAESGKKEGKAVIPVFRLAGPITEAPSEELYLFGGPTAVTLKGLLERMKKAQDEPTVKAVVILPEGGSVGRAQAEELRQAIAALRAAGKDVYAHADSLSMRDYTLLSGVTRLSVVPTGDLWLTGLYAESPYLRGLLDKLGVKPDFLHQGAYKSAAEIFMRTGPSPEAEKMQNWLLDSLYESAVGEIAKGRGLKADKVKELIDAGPYTAAAAKKAKLIDAVEYRQDFEAMLQAKYGKKVVFDKQFGKKKQPKLDLTSPFAGFKLLGDLLGQGKSKTSGKPAVAIVYVEGPIVLGGGEPSPFGTEAARSTHVRRALDKAASDPSVKAVVLRVNSPGGSATASEIILNATRRVKAKKPFVVSMGDVAGSGGYYVACASDTIFADNSTITASIGVVGGKLVTNDMWNKVGITFKEYKRGKNAGMLSTSKTFDKEERARMDKWMGEIYGVFKGHVVAARGKRLKKPIDELAGGRVFTGRQALELGLVDKIGSMEDAIRHVAAEAKIKKYEVRVIPEPKNFLERVLEELEGGAEEQPGLDTAGRRPALRRPGSLVDLAMPYLKGLDPERMRLVVSALRRLDLVRQEGAVLMMPEMSFGR